MPRRRRHTSGLSLVELLIVIVILSIVAATIVPNANTGLTDQLEMAGRVLVADLDYARSLAVAHNSKYRVTFDKPAHSWMLTHSGTNAAHDTLPPSPFGSRQDPANQQTTHLRTLPGMRIPVSLFGLYSEGSVLQPITEVEFGPLGSTTRSGESVVWLSIGAGAATRYVEVRINPITGLATLGNFRSTPPPITTASVITSSE